MTLRCWKNGSDTVSAESAEDAVAVLREVYGEDSGVSEQMVVVDDAAEFSVYDEDVYLARGEECTGCGFGVATSPNGHNRGCAIGCPTKTAAQWAEHTGRGLVCSTER